MSGHSTNQALMSLKAEITSLFSLGQNEQCIAKKRNKISRSQNADLMLNPWPIEEKTMVEELLNQVVKPPHGINVDAKRNCDVGVQFSP